MWDYKLDAWLSILTKCFRHSETPGGGERPTSYIFILLIAKEVLNSLNVAIKIAEPYNGSADCFQAKRTEYWPIPGIFAFYETFEVWWHFEPSIIWLILLPETNLFIDNLLKFWINLTFIHFHLGDSCCSLNIYCKAPIEFI